MGKFGRLNGLIYCCIFGELQRIAWENGYSLAVHGSMDRDFDVVAIPWIEAAISAEDLITKFHVGIKAEFETEPENKPHGRRAWVLGAGSGLGIDVSVMPRNRDIIMPDYEKRNKQARINKIQRLEDEIDAYIDKISDLEKSIKELYRVNELLERCNKELKLKLGINN